MRFVNIMLVVTPLNDNDIDTDIDNENDHDIDNDSANDNDSDNYNDKDNDSNLFFIMCVFAFK